MSEGDPLVDIIHTGCGYVAFRYLGRPITGERIDSTRAKLLDGRRPYPGDLMHCGTCGERVGAEELVWRS